MVFLYSKYKLIIKCIDFVKYLLFTFLFLFFGITIKKLSSVSEEPIISSSAKTSLDIRNHQDSIESELDVENESEIHLSISPEVLSTIEIRL
jgi:hypothetical protein